MQSKRLFIVANRLPVTVDESGVMTPCSGGLVSAISSYLSHACSRPFNEVFWSGVPGCSPAAWAASDPSAQKVHYRYLPVFVEKKRYEGYYGGFANSVLWPLFHYFPSYAEYVAGPWEHYLEVNAAFAEVLQHQLRPQDTVWIHDYHLLPLAGLLREAVPGITIGFFLHIPFPSHELVRLLPRHWQVALLQGMLGADLIGFHTMDYAVHFLQSVQLVLGLDNEQHVLQYRDRLVKVDVFPISVDFLQFHQAYGDPGVAVARQSIREGLPGKKILFSVDRLDYTKGLNNRLKAYACFLRNNPQYHGKVVFIMVIVPSRDNLARYAERKRTIDETISGINSELGSLHWQPVIYQYQSLSFEQMVALYTAADLAFITPLRDGMNLVAKEFVASREDGRGVLLLSEMAGAARELTTALIINPNDLNEMAEKIRTGLEMPPEEQGERIAHMQARLRDYDVQTWAGDFLTQLNGIKCRQQTFAEEHLDTYTRCRLLDEYRVAGRRLLLLDYDGTLVPFSSNPEQARPGLPLLHLLQRLCADESNDVYLISGRTAAWLEQHFGSLHLHLIGEHGAQIRHPGTPWTELPDDRGDWKQGVRAIMESYTRRCPDTIIEAKQFSMVWHYRNANAEQGRLRSQELAAELQEFVHHLGLLVQKGNKIVEVRRHDVHKGTAVVKAGGLDPAYSFVLALGDDTTDEDMFRALLHRPQSYTIKVGAGASFARYNLLNPQMVLSLLDHLAHFSRKAAVA
ncbi:MAG TPA: bifunctional alpha,alpha-trehalose-phosphate synthase (UDP-forming)/trehalose-phosphatase [Chitinophagaceae bacterium]|jgi:trehalose 6-phosphate synthase/phosphatase|nr:bifunctional alpha,alpha-trehalose-phosphate synthase (UDP-forming)/trehalose-phosphatase [Chitinophagaceae bacterium]